MRKLIFCTVILGAALAGWRVAARTHGGNPSPGVPAASLYDRFCLACHGASGDGKGPAAPWLWPRPRDFTRGEFKWRSTPTGAPPTDADLAAAIRHGAAGTSMHAFGATLDDAQVRSLVDYVKGFAPEVFAGQAPPVVSVGAPPRVTPDVLARGEKAYRSLGCVACHGEEGKGDGLAAANLRTAGGLPAPPYDLTALPLRRPSPRPGVADIYKSLVTGLSGTPMPAYMGAADDEDLWALAAYVDSIRFKGELDVDPTVVDPAAVDIDREQRLARAGYWPGNGTAADMAVFGQIIAPQGPAPASLAPAQASVNARQCGRCHAKQVREWTGSLHAGAGSPGLIAQVERMTRGRPRDRGGRSVESCQRCHAPLGEQQPVIRSQLVGAGDGYVDNPVFDERLRRQGVNCASCHVRGWRRFGPPRAAGSKLLGAAGYPFTEAPIYERSDFCLPCHQLPPRNALEGKPLLNTYREWLEGPYMRRGIQCQHCHMPNREHTWKGVHDPETFREGIAVDAIAGRSRTTGAVSVRARVTNVGAGHYLPTTPTPAAWLSVELVDEDGQRIPGAYAEKRIGRHLTFDGGFKELEDTRIPPGESIELAAAWKDGDVDRATAAKIVVRVAPDDYYEGLYRRRLRRELDADVRAMFEKALRRARSSHYVAEERLVALE